MRGELSFDALRALHRARLTRRADWLLRTELRTLRELNRIRTERQRCDDQLAALARGEIR